MALADYIHHKPVIETDRLIIRPMVPSDIPSLYEWMPDKTIYTYCKRSIMERIDKKGGIRRLSYFILNCFCIPSAHGI
ncbi:MAG: hypothetical protein IJM59_11950 [Proteobacteria bacterium]|nr:hypothetical protein [Pseudomonadota bacterium]